MIISNKTLVVNWLFLMALTVLAVMLSSFLNAGTAFIVCSLLIVFLKGKQIVDVFMELETAPKNWRRLFLAYVIILPTVICVIYLL